jgi:hypothetical protein
MWRVELSRVIAAITPRFDPASILVGLGDAGVDISIADEDVALGTKRDICWLPEPPSSAGKRGIGCFNGPVLSSDASCFRPKTMVTRPSGLNLMIMSDPLSMAQILSSLSMRTACANDHA